jgi:HD-GYP domain-containing protein (c-di-GMP phosphodiesterase class II)
MTVRLAKACGIGQLEIAHWQRGATLHDIGKLGIPDQILLKTTPFTDEDWGYIRRHPQIAYDLLSPIVLLCPALDIPYYHHEKWDGSGYLFGLKGEQIPLSARIFAVVDVFDALTSDHFYRKAWTIEKSLAFIQEQSGRHFDPKVVEVFLKLHASP